MKVTIAEAAGFCFGVKRAVDTLQQQLDLGVKVCTLGPLIHNAQVVDSFEKQGVKVVKTLDQVPEGYHVVVRSHGVRREIIREMQERSISYTDSTCPYVTNIHNIAACAAAQGKFVLMAGDENHPEIQGIISHCVSGYECFSSLEELEELTGKDEFFVNNQCVMVAQTTFREKEWLKCKNFTKNTYTNIEIFDTICKATMLRQEAAEKLAVQSDCMIVVGGYNSSNTQKLTAICKEKCRTIQIETPEELANYDFSGIANIGVTAGASTPAFIIKEVQNSMSDVVNNKEEANFEEMSFEEMLNETFKIVSAREKVTAVVTSVAPNEIAVDIGTKHAGYVPLDEYTDDPNANLEELVKPGDEIELIVLRLNDAEGTALLSKKRLDAIAGFEKIVAAEEADECLTGKVVDIVKGGIIALTNGVRVFIPASQVSVHRNTDLEAMRGQEVEYKVLETNPNRRRAVGSIRAILQAEREKLAKEFWEKVEAGQIRKGIVKSMTNYGAFIDLGGVDGMIHISEISWSRIKHPSDVLSVGQEVEVVIKDINREEEKISLGYKDEQDNPWNILKKDFKAGNVVKVKVVSLTPFGAFAQVIPGVDGLIHISQISHERIEKPSDVLSVGQEVDVAITDIDFDEKRVSLSIRALLDDEKAREEEERKSGSSEPEIVAQAAPPEEEIVAQAAPPEEEDTAATKKEKAVEKVKEVTENLADKAKEVKEDIADKAEKVADKAKDVAEDVTDKAKEVKEDVAEKAEKVAKKAKAVKADAEAKAEKAVEEVKEALDEVSEELKVEAESVAEDIKEVVKDIKEEIVEKLTDDKD